MPNTRLVRHHSVDHVAALAALYQGEKTDAAYIFNTAMVMMGAAVTYVVGVIAFADKFGAGPFSWPVVLLLPSPLWLIAAFHSLITLNAMSHGVSVRIIENALFKEACLQADRDLVGSAAGDKIMDITISRPIHKLTTLVVYGGIALLVVGFTAYAVYRSWSEVSVRALIISMTGYSLLFGIVASSWLEGFRLLGDANRRSRGGGPGTAA